MKELQKKVRIDIADLQEMNERSHKVAPIFKAGSALGKGISVVNYLLDKLKSIGWGVAWKAVSKTVPPIRILDDSIQGLEDSIKRLAGPTDALCKHLPSVIVGIQAEQNGQPVPEGFAGQLGLVISIMPTLHSDLNNLNTAMLNTCQLIGAIVGSMERLASIKGIGSLSEKLKEALLKLQEVMTNSQGAIQQLVDSFERSSQWLPAYHRQIRQVVTSDKSCQMITKSSFFSKEYCWQPVSWFNDEASANCDKCGIVVCTEHRVEMITAMDVPVRCKWLCMKCANK